MVSKDVGNPTLYTGRTSFSCILKENSSPIVVNVPSFPNKTSNPSKAAVN